MKSAKKITEPIKKFADSIVKNGTLIFVRSQPIRGEKILECYETVSNKIARHGGERILGWCFFEWPGVLLEAELHAVWKRHDGLLIDIAPHQVKQSKILFLPDSKATVPRVQEPNRYFPLGNDPMIQSYIELEDRSYRSSNPENRYHIPSNEYIEIRHQTLETKASLAKKYGLPPGTTIVERLLERLLDLFLKS